MFNGHAVHAGAGLIIATPSRQWRPNLFRLPGPFAVVVPVRATHFHFSTQDNGHAFAITSSLPARFRFNRAIECGNRGRQIPIQRTALATITTLSRYFPSWDCEDVIGIEIAQVVR